MGTLDHMLNFSSIHAKLTEIGPMCEQTKPNCFYLDTFYHWILIMHSDMQ